MHREALAAFDAVCDLPDAEREAAIARLCSGRPDVERVVRGMLAAEASSLALTGAGGELLAQDLADDEGAVPERIGRYKVLGELGRGGMGRVLDAEQEQPRRRVALKILRRNLVSPRARALLEGEAQALATLLHPGIPQVYEAFDADGVTGLVMERVDGVPLLAWARGRDVRERVGMVRRIAEAVAHAHVRGLLHRDLKPGNVLVTADGQPKVLDFGLATVLGTSSDVAGTPEYMAPEQLAGEALDVRADVYALGLVLADVLGGDRRARKLPRGVDRDGDLRAILRRATSADRAVRYRSVDAFADDLDRWLDHRPVLARKGGRAYEARKFVRRHRGLVGASALVAALLMVATAFASVMAVRANRSRQAAELERTRATADARRARQTSAFLGEVFLRAHPNKGSGERTVLDATRAAAKKLDEGGLADAPEEEAALRLTVAETLFSVGEAEPALAQVEKVVAAWRAGRVPVGPLVIDALHGTAEVYRTQKREAESDAALDEALRMAEATHDRRRPCELLHSRGWARLQRARMAEAEDCLARALAIKRELLASGELQPWDFGNTACALAVVWMRTGRLEQADALFDEAWRLLHGAVGETHFATATIAHWRAALAIVRRDLDAAQAWLDRAAAAREALGLPTTSPARSREGVDRAHLVALRGEPERAVAMLEEHIAATFGGWDGVREPEVALVRVEILLAAGRRDEALAAADFVAKVAGDDPLGAAHARHALGLARGEGGRADLDAAHAAYVALLGPDSSYARRTG